MERYVRDSLDPGFIHPLSSPFFVKKKDGTLRPCIDYRGLKEKHQVKMLNERLPFKQIFNTTFLYLLVTS